MLFIIFGSIDIGKRELIWKLKGYCINWIMKSISHHDMGLYDNVKNIYKDQLKVECTECRYRIPCPNGVDIPQCFTLYNQKHIYNNMPHLTYI
jgi:predicted aldo/keto reductase-like oxidoreductase